MLTSKTKTLIRRSPYLSSKLKELYQTIDEIGIHNDLFPSDGIIDTTTENNHLKEFSNLVNLSIKLFSLNYLLIRNIETYATILGIDTDEIGKCKLNLHNHLTEIFRDKIPPKFYNCLPNEIIFKTCNSDSMYGKFNIIVTGSNMVEQSKERIESLINYLDEKKITPSQIRYIIFTGRGCGKSLKKCEINERYIKKKDLSQFNKSFNLIDLGDFKVFDDSGKEDLQWMNEYCVKTEAHLMYEYFTEIKPEFKDLVIVEEMSLDTSANFILTPMAIVKKTGKSLEDILDELLNDTLIVCSSDYHIIRCMSLVIQIFRDTDENKVNSFIGNNVIFVNSRVKVSENRVLGSNFFSSLFQPYEQLFMEGHKETLLNSNAKYSIIYPKMKYQTIREKYIKILTRLLLDHGLYSKISNQDIKFWHYLIQNKYNILDVITLNH